MKLVKIFISGLLCLLFQASSNAQGSWSTGLSAAETSWNYNFQPLQTPNWDQKLHPSGVVDVQWRHVFVEAGGDPHRPRESSTLGAGFRADLLRVRRFSLYGQVSVGGVLAPSFLEYCGGYEYKPDCHAGNEAPEYCWWWSLNAGLGTRVRLTRHLALEPLRVEYLNPFAIGPRWRLGSGFRVSF